jgi:hypothetical protein
MLLAAGLLALLTGAGFAALAFAAQEKGDEGPGGAGGRPLEQAREESGVTSRPPTRYALPDAQLTVTPSELLAGTPGQTIRFSLHVERRLPGATLDVTLPSRWLARPASGLPGIRAPLLTGRGAENTRLRRRDRVVALAFDSAGTGDVASFEVKDVGIPAGSYRLPFRWRDADGRTRRAGSVSVVLYARTREGGGASPFGRLANPGISTDVAADTNEESETFLAVDPGDNTHIAAGSNWQSLSMPAWISTDAGQTWTRRTLPNSLDAPGEANAEAGDICCDPMFAADDNHNIWYGGLSFANGSGNPSRIVVNRIDPVTNNFQTRTVGLPVRTSGTQDKPLMTVDNGPASPTNGRLYVVWDEPSGGGINIVMSKCDSGAAGTACDEANNWSTPVSVTKASGSYIYPDVAVGPDGKVYVTWWDYSNANAIRGSVCNAATTSCTAVAGWSAAQTIAVLDSTTSKPVPFACPIVAQPGGRAAPAPQVDVDHSGGANDGRVYVTWSDLRPGSGTTRCAINPSTGQGTPPLATHLTWDSFVVSAPGALPGSAAASTAVGTKLLNDGEGGGQSNSDDWFPWLAVDQSSGVAWADFYSTRDDATRNKTNFYARSVTPNGASHTLGTLTKVSNAQSDYSGEPCCDFGNDYGDYTGLDASQGIAYPVWTDNSTGDGDPHTFVATTPGQAPTVTTNNPSPPNQTSATLTGTVNNHNQASTYHFEYGTTDFDQSTPSPPGNLPASASNQPVTAGLTGLTPGTTYKFRLVADNATGTTTSTEKTFTTTMPPTPTAPSATTNPASNIGQTSATLNATINPSGSDTSYHFEYGPSSSTAGNYPSQTPSTQAGSGFTSVSPSEAVQALDEGTTYYFRVVASNGIGPADGGEQSFKTASPTAQLAPSVVTGSASFVSTSSATISGTVNPNSQASSYAFKYGRTALYGSSTTVGGAGSGNSAQAVSAGLSFLSPDTTYHYSLTASNATGVSSGSDRTFRTGSVFTPPPVFPPPTPDTTPPNLAVSSHSRRLTRRGSALIPVECAAFEPAPCAGVLRLYTANRVRTRSGRKRLKLGAANFTLAPGQRASVRIRLGRTGRRLVRRSGRLRALAKARARDAAGNLGTADARFWLRPFRS